MGSPEDGGRSAGSAVWPAYGLAWMVPNDEGAFRPPGFPSDLFFVAASDNAEVGCVDKSFGWLMAAVEAFPAAQFIVKTDDDSATHMPSLTSILQLLQPRRFVYSGWAQFASVLPSTWQQCGWGPSPSGAIKRQQVSCPAGAASQQVEARPHFRSLCRASHGRRARLPSDQDA